MKPARSKQHLAFVRSLPCCVSGRTYGVEAAHIGHRGMGQKCSDFETIPLNKLYHREQHRIGLKAFTAKYQLDIPGLFAFLATKPQMKIWDGRYIGHCHALGREYVFNLTLVEYGLTSALICLRDRWTEIVSEEIRSLVRRSRADAKINSAR
jgi:hypothetical protein